MLERLLFVGEREDWASLMDQPLVRMFAQDHLPALFKVPANCCNVALLGSTPKVSEKSLERVSRIEDGGCSNKWKGRRNAENKRTYLQCPW